MAKLTERTVLEFDPRNFEKFSDLKYNYHVELDNWEGGSIRLDSGSCHKSLDPPTPWVQHKPGSGVAYLHANCTFSSL